jgi:shikimate dehydrogenase
MSAAMHNAAFKKLNLNFRYELRSIPPVDLINFVDNELRKPKVRGANITIPHKQSIIQAIDEIDKVAARIGAVNTLVKRNGKLKGYNTDIIGASRSLKESYGGVENSSVVILGAGGASKAVSYFLAKKALSVTIINRTDRNAVKLAKQLSLFPECTAEIQTMPLNQETLETAVKEADILVNTTSVGMFPKTEETLVSKSILHNELLVFDLVYNPHQTRLMREAEDTGASVIGGISMLVYQGVEAFKLWTERNPPEELMFKIVKENLGVVQ